MSPKTVLIILVVIAVVVGAAIWRGQRDEPPADSKENREHPPGENSSVFKLFSGGGDTIAIARLQGCNRSGRVFTFSGNCTVRIVGAAKPRQSRFVLKAFSKTVLACFGFTMKQFEDCNGDDDKKGWLKPDGKSRFVVGRDESILGLYCKASNNNCTVTVE